MSLASDPLSSVVTMPGNGYRAFLWIALVAQAIAYSWIGWAFVSSPEVEWTFMTAFFFVFMIVVTLLFLAMTWLALTQMLNLEPDQFEYRLAHRVWRRRWTEVEQIYLNEGQIMIEWRGEGPEFALAQRKPVRATAIPLLLGVGPSKLASLMTRFHERALAGSRR